MSSPNLPADRLEMIAQFKDKLGIGEDKVHAAMGTFSTPEELVEAGKKIKAMGYTKLDAMTPFPVHGLDPAIGIPASKLGWVSVTFAMLGLLAAQGLIYYVGVLNYPLDIGGKPLFDFTFTIPVTFELTILFTGIATFVTLWAFNGLPRLYHPTLNYRNSDRANDDAFILIVEADDPMFEPQKTAEHLRSLGAADVEVVEG